MPESVFTQTMPLGLAGGECCCAVGLAGAEELEELGGAGMAVGVGLVAGAGVEPVRVDADVAAGELAGELAAGVLPWAASDDFFGRDFFAVVLSAALVSAVSGLPADFVELLFFVVVAESAAAELSAASADFLERLFFVVVASASAAEAVVASAASALLFFERLFFVPVSADVELSAGFVEPALSAASADFLELLFFVADLPLSAAVELSAESALALFFERLLLAEESEVAGLSALSVLFFLALDLVLLLESVVESVVDCEESSALAFFLDFFFVVVELSL